MNDKSADVNWESLKAIRAWTPLESLKRFSKTPVAEGLCRVADHAYLFSVPEMLKEGAANGPFTTVLLWAESDGAARRAMLMDIEADTLNKKIPPPSEMLPKLNCSSYGDLISHLKYAGLHRPFKETASYRIARDGALVSRNIFIDNWIYMFRGRRKSNADTPFAIQYRLLD